MSGIENLEYFVSLGRSIPPDRTELRTILRRSGLAPEAADRRVSGYSKGMRQKVGVAIAIAKGAKALLLDEPTSGLDPAASNDFARVLRELAAEGVAVLMATHDLFNARECGTHVGIMHEGTLVTSEKVTNLQVAELESLYLSHVRH